MLLPERRPSPDDSRKVFAFDNLMAEVAVYLLSGTIAAIPAPGNSFQRI